MCPRLHTLDAQCAALLPAELVAGQSVVDLGACLGAMCHWALSFGAERAIAVEAQPDFCDRAAALLETAWGGGERARVVNTDIRGWLAAQPDRSAGVLVAAGVLHCFVDPVGVILELARVADRGACCRAVAA